MSLHKDVQLCTSTSLAIYYLILQHTHTGMHMLTHTGQLINSIQSHWSVCYIMTYVHTISSITFRLCMWEAETTYDGMFTKYSRWIHMLQINVLSHTKGNRRSSATVTFHYCRPHKNLQGSPKVKVTTKDKITVMRQYAWSLSFLKACPSCGLSFKRI